MRRLRQHLFSVKLHWLLIRQRISYKLAMLTFKVQAAFTFIPQHLSSLLSVPRSTGTRFGQLTAHCCPCREQEHQLHYGVSLAQDLSSLEQFA